MKAWLVVPVLALLTLPPGVGNEESGTVLPGAAYGLVHFRLAPYVLTLPPLPNGFHLWVNAC